MAAFCRIIMEHIKPTTFVGIKYHIMLVFVIFENSLKCYHNMTLGRKLYDMYLQ